MKLTHRDPILPLRLNPSQNMISIHQNLPSYRILLLYKGWRKNILQVVSLKMTERMPWNLTKNDFTVIVVQVVLRTG
jgi:hypothetical protein